MNTRSPVQNLESGCLANWHSNIVSFQCCLTSFFSMVVFLTVARATADANIELDFIPFDAK